MPPDDLLVVFQSDHGESLGEHSYWGHGRHLYEPTLWVPMGLKWKDHLRPRVVPGPSLNIDLAPTWAELAGVAPPDFVDGRSLVPLLGADPPPTDRWRQCFLLEHAPFEPPGRTPVALAAASNTPPGLLEPPDPGRERYSETLAWQSSSAEALPYRGLRSADVLYVEYPTGERELYDLVSNGAAFDLRDAVLEDPSLIGSALWLWVPASDDVDMYMKG